MNGINYSMKHIFLLFTLLITAVGFSQIECPIDVVINEGSSIEMCKSDLQSLNATTGYVSYSWSGPETGTGQSFTPSVSGQFIVAADDGNGCVSHDTIDVIVHQIAPDAIVSSNGTVICPSTGTDLSLSNTYVSYQWSNGVTTPTNTVFDAGSYFVLVTDNNGCTATYSFILNEIPFDVQQSTNTGCSGSAVTLTASGGDTYLWSTGETGSTIVVSPANTTTYSVTITNGSCSETLTTSVAVTDEEPFELPDTIYIELGDELFIAGPPNFDTYNWTPSNVVSDPTSPNIYFVGTETTTVGLEATNSAGCIIIDEVVIIVVDLTIPNGFSPNIDGKNDKFVIPEADEYTVEFTVFNRWGDIVYDSENYQNDWDGTCLSDFCFGEEVVPDGTYYYMVKVEEITFKGFITVRK